MRSGGAGVPFKSVFKQGNTCKRVFNMFNVCVASRDRYRLKLYSFTQYFWHTDKAL